MTVFDNQRTISGADTPVQGTDDGGIIYVTADATVTLNNTGWTVGRSAVAFEIKGSGVTVTFTGSGTTVAGNNGLSFTGDNNSAVAVYSGTNEWTIHSGVSTAAFLTAANNLSDLASAATARTNLGVAIGSDVQAHSAVLDGTTASFTTADETKLDGIEAGADVTDAANVAAAGAYVAGGTDVPVVDGGTGASTAAGARANLGVAIGSDVQAYDANNATTATRLDEFAAPTADVDVNDQGLLQVGPIERRVYVDTTSGTAQTLDNAEYGVFEVTLDNNCTFTFSNPAASGEFSSFVLKLTQDGTGSRVVTLPASVDWHGGSAPTLSTAANAVDVLQFCTWDGGTIWHGMALSIGSA